MTSQPSTSLNQAMLPAIRAVVLRRQTWLAIGILLFWGVLNSLWIAVFLLDDGATPDPMPTERSFAIRALLTVDMAIGPAMILAALFGAVTRHPRTIGFVGTTIILVGCWNILSAITLLVFWSEYGLEVTWVIAGLLQIAMGIYARQQYTRLQAWLPEVAEVGEEQLHEANRFLKQFTNSDESFADRRLRGGMQDRDFLSGWKMRGFRGQLLADRAILISQTRYECIVFSIADAKDALGKKGNVSVQTDQGRKRLRLRSLSRLCLLMWADVPISPADLRAVAKARKMTPELIEVLLRHSDPVVRSTTLGLIRTVKQPKQYADVAVSFIADPAAEVRAASLDACRQLKLDGLWDRVVPLLGDEQPSVRTAAAAYIARFPHMSAVKPLQTAVLSESERSVLKPMHKALKTCEKVLIDPTVVS